MNRFFISMFLTISLCLSVSLALADVKSQTIPAVTGPIVKSPDSCNAGDGWISTQYNGKDSCVRCNERNGWHYAKYNGKDNCVRCDERNGWRYDGNKYCVK